MIPIVAVALYGLFIGLGKWYFSSRPAWSWRRTLAFWNLGLSVFSWIGMARTLPQLVHNLSTMSLRDNLCLDPRMTYGSGSTGLWVQLFILSKFPWVLLMKNQSSPPWQSLLVMNPLLQLCLVSSSIFCIHTYTNTQRAHRYLLHRDPQEAAHLSALVPSHHVRQSMRIPYSIWYLTSLMSVC